MDIFLQSIFKPVDFFNSVKGGEDRLSRDTKLEHSSAHMTAALTTKQQSVPLFYHERKQNGYNFYLYLKGMYSVEMEIKEILINTMPCPEHI